MSSLGKTSITLPSRGIFYGGKVPDGTVEVRKLLTGEQKVVSAQSLTPVQRLMAVAKAVSTIPNGFPFEELLLADGMAVLLASRTFSLGPDYTVNYRCDECGSQETHRVSIVEDLSEKPVTDANLSEPFPVELPDRQVTVHLRFLRVKDMDRIAKVARRVMLSSQDDSDPSFFYRRALQVVRIGEEEHGIAEVEEWLRSLTMLDGNVWSKAVDKLEPGIDLRIVPTCKKCGSLNRMDLPFDVDFFRHAPG